jgi:exopolyphosphatase/guanosine-5'-triphosphate,3'-diphosphate pyrophosphatase
VNAAAIDIGSNSVRLLIADQDGVEVCREVTVTGLGRGVEATGMMADGPIEATIEALTLYSDLMARHKVGRRTAVATSASRDAANGPDVMERIEEVICVAPEIISGDREASLSFSGATKQGSQEGTSVVVDIGGGSTEVVVGDTSVARAKSFDIGSVRLTDRALPERPATADQVRDAAVLVDAVIGDVGWASDSRRIIGVAGTFTSLSAINLGLAEYTREAVHGSVLTDADVTELVETLGAMTLSQTRDIPSLDPKRAPVILSGAVIAQRVLRAIGGESVMVSESDLLDGLMTEIAYPGLPAT